MSEPVRARLVPLKPDGRTPRNADEIVFDINPETLRLAFSGSTESPGQNTRQQVQATGVTRRTLSFDAIFDTTRPSPDDGGIGLGVSAGVSVGASASLTAGASASVGAGVSAGVEVGASFGADSSDPLDVRNKTSKIAALLRVQSLDQERPTPANVRFQWGRIIFDGYLESFTETLEYFSHDGIPLRSKVQLQLREQDTRQQAEGARRASLALSLGFDAGLGLDLSFGGGIGFGASFGAGASLGLSGSVGIGGSLGAGAAIGAALGAGTDLAGSSQAGVPLSPDASLGVFGGNAVAAAVGGDADLSASQPVRTPPQASPTPTAWAPAGAPASSAAAALAAVVNEARATGLSAAGTPDPGAGAFTATRLTPTTAADPVPVRGAPPTTVPRRGPVDIASVFPSRTAGGIADTRGINRPSWEGLGPARPSRTAPAADPCCEPCSKTRRKE